MKKLPPDARCIMFACHNIRSELLISLDETERGGGGRSRFPIIYIPTESHLFPEKLRATVQNLIDVTENVDYIILPMGRCGNGTLGLVSKNATLVLPKCNDCIDLLLSEQVINTERPKYSYFLTDGWLGSPASIDSEYSYTINKYGKKRGEMIIKMMYANYKYFSFVDTKSYDLEMSKKKIESLVAMTGMEINTLPGPFGVLRKMVKLEFDENFALVPPGEAVSEEHFAQ